MLARPTVGRWQSPRIAYSTDADSWFADHVTLSTISWGVANRAIYVPVQFRRRVVVRKLGFSNASTATGNYDLGLYDASGTRLASSGSQTKTTAATIITYDMTDQTFGPGLYYLALNNDTTTDTFQGHQLTTLPQLAAYGVLTESLGSVTLPATATWAVDNTLTIAPVMCALLVTEVT